MVRRQRRFMSQNSERRTSGGEATIKSLAASYQEDQRSPYHRLRHRTREHYENLIRRLVDEYGKEKLAELKAPEIQRFYYGWTEGGKIAMGHSLITMFRALVTFGKTVLNIAECERLSVVLHNMRFSVIRSPKEQLTAEHVRKIISKAYELGRPSIALAQAFQFDCGLRQKDVIGEWVPITEPGDVRGDKWQREVATRTSLVRNR